MAENTGSTPPATGSEEKKARQIVEDLAAQQEKAGDQVTTPVPAPSVTVTPAPVPATVPVQDTPPATQEVEQVKAPLPVYNYVGPKPKVAVLVTGGFNSTILMLLLLQGGYELFPIYYTDGSRKARRERRRLRNIIKIIRASYGDEVHKLETVDIKLKDEEIFRAALITETNKRMKGEGINALGIGLFSDSVDEDAPEEEREDKTIAFLQDSTPVQLIGFSTLDADSLGVAVGALVQNPVKSALFLATSCLKDGKKHECGDCDNCKARHKALMQIWGEDQTTYKKGSKVWRRIQRENEPVQVPPAVDAAAPATPPAPTPEPVKEEKEASGSSESDEKKHHKKHKKHKKGSSSESSESSDSSESSESGSEESSEEKEGEHKKKRPMPSDESPSESEEESESDESSEEEESESSDSSESESEESSSSEE